jgi:monofunctional glycosyltransferase
LELPLAYIMSLIWPKQRMIEVYLNVAEFGRGIYGAEEASRHYFGKSAADLTRHEAVLLAVTLPAPHIRNPRKPSLRMLRIARAVELRMPIIAKRGACVLPTR